MKMKKNDNKLLKIFDFRLFSHAVAVVIAVVISYLSQDPVIAASISTITGLVIGFAASNLIGNIIAGIYLAITRLFRIGDRIKVFNGDGKVSDIGLLYTRLLLDNGDEMLASNSSLVTTNIIFRKKEKEEQKEGNQEQ
jgi:small conductance mechanosensitive channel